MKLTNALERIITTLKEYIDNVTPKKLSDLEIDMELGTKPVIATVVKINDKYSIDKTYEEINLGIDQGKSIIVKYESQWFNIDNYNDSSIIFASLGNSDGIDKIELKKDGTILYYKESFENIKNKVYDNLSLESTVDQYPSAYSVVKYVNEQIDSHDHDDIYYTESEIDEMINTVSNVHFIITVSSTTVDETTVYTADKTFAEIEEAYNNGCVLECNYNKVIYQLNSVYPSATFIFVNSGNNGHKLITFFKNGVIRHSETNYKNLIETIENNLNKEIANKADKTDIPTIDAKISAESENPVQNKVVKEYVDINLALKVDKSEIYQSDWNQNDETTNDYIKNRPFHDEIVTNEIVPHQTIKFNEDGSADFSSNFNLDNLDDLEIGTKVVVTFDGIVYNTEVISAGFWGDLYTMIHIVTEDNILVQIIFDSSNFVSAKLTGEHTLSVIEGTPLKQLDEKYIPYTIARVEQLPETITDEETLYMLAEAGLVNVITDENGNIFTDLGGNVIVF